MRFQTTEIDFTHYGQEHMVSNTLLSFEPQ